MASPRRSDSTPPGAACERMSGPLTPASGFPRLYETTVAPLRRYLSRLLGNATEAQDVAQDAFVRVHEAMSRRTLEHPQAFLYTTARRLAIDELRRRRADPLRHTDATVIDAVFSNEPGVERRVMARQELDDLLQVIGTLPHGCRTVFLLSRIDNLSHKEIAQRLGIAYSTVEKQHARALRLLRTRLASHSAEPFSTRAATGTDGVPRIPPPC